MLNQREPAPLLQVRVGGEFFAPGWATWDRKSRILRLSYGVAAETPVDTQGAKLETGASPADVGEGIQVTATVAIAAKPTHVVFELVAIDPEEKVELVLWGPFPTTIGETVGEVVGVVRDREFAVGIQALNAKTLGGYPTNENDIESEFTADDRGACDRLPSELKKDQLFRGDTARYAAFGSSLQAYCRNRYRDRTVANWGHDAYLAPAFDDGGVVGSKIALFACSKGEALDAIGAIEMAEGLPHPMLHGVWAKQAHNASCSYLIVDFGEDSIDQAIAMTRRAGLKWLYHSSPFETWGHFELKADLFPHGRQGFRACIEKARAAGVSVGFHTLSNFITPNDPYVTPTPDPRLARIGSSPLEADIGAKDKEIRITAPDIFRKKTAMSAVVIGDELIRYDGVSAEEPWRILNCERGAWGTAASAHRHGEPVAKLMDHDYNVFLTDSDLSQEVAMNIAAFCNETGTLQISLDGLEGNWSTGMGQYGRALFTKAWYDALAPEVRDQINDASNPGHFTWHIATRMNWGEPWYAGFRESQTLYRFKNQLFFQRNLMPHMLGWFALRPETTLEDAEWMLARAAGYDAGFALAVSAESTAQLEAAAASAESSQGQGAFEAILEAVRQWETARMAGAFSEKIKSALRDNQKEFHLEPTGPGRWDLFAVERARRFRPVRVKAKKDA